MTFVRLTRASLLKVPEIVALFWVVKLLSTAMGEAFSDYLVFHVNPSLAVVAATIGLAVALLIQLRASRYTAPRYWFAVVMVAVFGTMVADVLHVVLDIPYAVSAGALAATLCVVFVAWYRVEGTLSIHSIDTSRRELFYWAAVMATFALGTAAGDLTASTLGLGYPASALLFGIAFAVPGVGYRFLALEPDRSVLGRLHHHPSTRCIGGRLAGQERARWPGHRRRGGRRRLCCVHRPSRLVPDHLEDRRASGSARS